MKKIKLETIFINDSRADGAPFIDKNGSPYKLAKITWEDGEATMFLGKFGEKDEAVIKNWKPGDEVEVVIERNGDFVNFKVPKKQDMVEARVEKLEEQMGKVGKILKDLKSKGGDE